MCTLTVIPADGGFRLVVNRDEKRTRPLALPPAESRIGAVRAVWPVDALAGGTWIAMTDRGLALTVQNVNPTPAPTLDRSSLRSRGLVIPPLVEHASALDAVRAAASTLDLAAFAPFRLVAVDGEQIVDLRWDRERLEEQRRPLAPACFVSSGLGDALVSPRLTLWEMTVAERGATASTQDAFHRHRWPDRPEISVLMSRPDARTVSTTLVEIGSDAAGVTARMVHRSDAGERRIDLRPEAPRARALAGARAEVRGRATW